MESSRPLPAVRVRTWQVLLRMETGDRHLTPTPSGIHAMVSSWLHRSSGSDGGESHSEEHRYAVRWRQVSEFAVLVELRLFADFLTPLLVDRVAFGNRERLGMVTLRVEGVQEVASVSLAEITGRPSKGWRLRFPEGVTFKRGDVFMPWPDPYLLLGSIQRRLALICGRGRGERLPREVMASVFPRRWSFSPCDGAREIPGGPAFVTSVSRSGRSTGFAPATRPRRARSIGSSRWGN